MGAPFRVETECDILVRGSGQAELTRACLRSLYDGTQDVTFTVTYVDNGTPPGRFRRLLAEFPQAQYVRLPYNAGSVRGINLGLSVALWSSAPYVLLLDNDAEVPAGDPGWLRRFIGYLADPKVGAAGAISDYVSGVQNVRAYPDRTLGTPPTPATVLVSFALLLRKAAVEQVQFFDERYEPGNFEDYDYCLQLRQAGWKCVVADSVWLHHRGSQTFGRLGFAELLQRNQGLFVQKWGAPFLRSLGLLPVEEASHEPAL